MKSPFTKLSLLFTFLMLLFVAPGTVSAHSPTGGEELKGKQSQKVLVKVPADNQYSVVAGDNLGNHNATIRLNMGTNTINMGTGCRYAQIQTISNQKLSLGYWNGCIGPPSYSAIMTLKYSGVGTGNVGIGWNMQNPTYLLQLQTNSAAKPGSSLWTIASDRRLKKDIQAYSEGLAELRRINPVTYLYNGKAGIEETERFVGVIAQELQEVAPHMVRDYIYMADEKTEEKYLGVDLNALQFIELNAIKELDQELQAQKEINAGLQAELNELKTLVAQLVEGQQVNKRKAAAVLDQGAHLEQNNPNPFTESTTIRYELPEQVQQARIEVYDLNGNVVHTFKLDGARKQSKVVLEGKSLAAGTYFYKLVVNNQAVDVKRLVLTH